MSQTLKLPDELYLKLAQGAEQRGVTIESLLTIVSEAIARERAPESAHNRSRRIESLLTQRRTDSLTQKQRAELEELIDADYREAIVRADRLIAARPKRRERPRQNHSNSPKPSKRSRA
jgi:hypothetical protein